MASSGHPKAPAAVHHNDPEAGFSYAEPESSNQDSRKRSPSSRKRVIRNYVVSILIGFLVGGIIGMIIGLAIRYS